MSDEGISAVVDSVVSDTTDSSVDTAPDIGTRDTTAPVEPTEGERQPSDAERAVADGRIIPQQYRELFKKDPKLRGMFMSERAFREVAPGGPQQVRELMQKWDTLGGDDGIAAIESERSNWEALDSQFTSGDPKFVESIAEFAPEAFSKLSPVILDKLSQLDRPTYDHLMSRVVVNTIQPMMQRVYEALASDEKTKPIAQELSKWYGSIEDIATKQPEKKIDPERQKFEAEKAAFEQTKQQGFISDVRKNAEGHVAGCIDKGLSKEFARIGRNLANERKTDPEGFKILARNCDQAIAEEIQKDEAYQKNMRAILATGDREKALRFAQAKIDKVWPTVVPRTFQRFHKFFTRPAKQGAQRPEPGQQQPVGTVPLGRMPDPKELDWARMTAKGIKPIDGKAFLKGRKELVTF